MENQHGTELAADPVVGLIEGDEKGTPKDVALSSFSDVTGFMDISNACDVMEGIPLPKLEADVTIHDPGPEGLPQVGEKLLFVCPETKKGTRISVYATCMLGTCACEHRIGGERCQLKPCRFGALTFANGSVVNTSHMELFEGIADGYDIVDEEVPSYDCVNYNSILEEEPSEAMSRNVLDEFGEGRIAEAVTKPTCIHSLGAVPKSDGGYRTITDCSRPQGESVNNHSESLAPRFEFKRLDYVTAALTDSAYMSVVDIKSAYRAVSVNPDHWKFQGFRWNMEGEEHTFIDRRLCFGGSTAPYYFNLISDFIQENLTSDGRTNVMNYMDDFLVWATDQESCLEAQRKTTELLRYLGFYVSWKKVTAPSTKVQYLGIIINTVDMTLSIPDGKLAELRDLLGRHRKSRTISKKDLERLTGL